MQYLKILSCAVLSSVLIGCGGGGGSSGSNGSTDAADLTVTGYNLDLRDKVGNAKNTLTNSGSDEILLSVVALNASNNPVAGAKVAGSADGGVFTPIGTVTDAAGKFTGKISIGSDKSDRNITAHVTVNGITKSVTIPVTGSKISATPVPATPLPGQTVKLDVRVMDVLGAGIANAPVTLSGTAGFTGTSSVDIGGNLTVTAVAPLAAGSYEINIAASGVALTVPIQVGGTAKPNAVGLGNAASLNANPTSIAPNTAGSTTRRAKLSAKFLDASNGGIENMRVRFDLVPPTLGSGEFISTGTSLVYSDASGLAEADYVSGTRTSPTNGVTLRACYDVADFAAGACPHSVQATLTVNSQPLAISIGNFNLLGTGLGGIAYIEKFLIQVADSSGVAVPDAVVSASVDIHYYGKGTWVKDLAGKEGAGWVATCANEDSNRNGTLEIGEDVNGNAVLDPGKSEIVLSYVSGNKTDAQGQLLIQVSYPQNVGSWLIYAVKATTAVVGSEGTKERIFTTSVLESDVKNGAFRTSPYGIAADCTNPN